MRALSKDETKEQVLRRAAPVVAASVRRQLPELAPGLMQFGFYWPHDYPADSFSRPILPDDSTISPDSAFPVPPQKYWANYGTTVEAYLASGRDDVETMTQLLGESDFAIDQAGRILDLGCAGGRMIRWLADLAPEVQLWGTDIWSSAILWCQDHLSPPINFATTTMVPHLPFEDRSFGLAYCGSLFTHIDDLAETWFLELHRILRPGGRLCFSVNDRHAISVLEGDGKPEEYARYYERTEGRPNWDRFVASYSQLPGYQRLKDGSAYMTTSGRSMRSHVMWDSDKLCRRLEWGYRMRSITPESYGHQTTVLLERI